MLARVAVRRGRTGDGELRCSAGGRAQPVQRRPPGRAIGAHDAPDRAGADSVGDSDDSALRRLQPPRDGYLGLRAGVQGAPRAQPRDRCVRTSRRRSTGSTASSSSRSTASRRSDAGIGEDARVVDLGVNRGVGPGLERRGRDRARERARVHQRRRRLQAALARDPPPGALRSTRRRGRSGRWARTGTSPWPAPLLGRSRAGARTGEVESCDVLAGFLFATRRRGLRPRSAASTRPTPRAPSRRSTTAPPCAWGSDCSATRWPASGSSTSGAYRGDRSVEARPLRRARGDAAVDPPAQPQPLPRQVERAASRRLSGKPPTPDEAAVRLGKRAIASSARVVMKSCR